MHAQNAQVAVPARRTAIFMHNELLRKNTPYEWIKY